MIRKEENPREMSPNLKAKEKTTVVCRTARMKEVCMTNRGTKVQQRRQSNNRANKKEAKASHWLPHLHLPIQQEQVKKTRHSARSRKSLLPHRQTALQELKVIACRRGCTRQIQQTCCGSLLNQIFLHSNYLLCTCHFCRPFVLFINTDPIYYHLHLLPAFSKSLEHFL